jgi:hypothetical protein
MALSIQSPGVQIIETDLSQTITVPTGTSVYVAGFAPQGPTDEVIQVTSISEFESIFGTPTNAAESYFYYNCQAVLNSTGSLLTTRLPYGSGSGLGFAATYSALIFPVLSSQQVTNYSNVGFTFSTVPTAYSIGTLVQYVSSLLPTGATTVLANQTSVSNNDNLTNTWIGTYSGSATANGGFTVGAPTHVTLTQSQALAIEQSNFTWGQINPGSVGITTGSNGVPVQINGGLIILNSAQTAVDEYNQGYYVNIADNTNWGPTAAFTEVRNVVGLADQDTFQTIPATSLAFTLTAAAGTQGNSISQVIESIPTYNFGNESYNDSLVLSLFKIRKSTYQPNVLTYSLVESYIGSLNSNRTTSAPTGGAPQSFYLQNLVNNNSNNINLYVNPTISKQTNWVSASANIPSQSVRVATAAANLYAEGVYDPTYSTNGQVIGSVDQKITRALSLVSAPETTTVDLVVDAGLSTIFANTSGAGLGTNGIRNNYYDDTIYADVNSLSAYGTSLTLQNWNTIFNIFNNFCQNTRKDCMFIADPLRQIFVNGPNTKTLDNPNNNFTSNIYQPLQNSLANIDTNYSAIYGNWLKTYNAFSNSYIWVPASGFAAATYANSDTATQPWYAPAGLNRGQLQNITDIAFNPNQKQRDYLYTISVNPVALFNGEGYVLFGQKTLQALPSAFDRINVRRLFLVLERAVNKALKYFVFEPNTVFTRTRLVNTINPIFDLAKNTQGLYDYLVVCDQRNNTPAVIDNNQLNVDIYIKPVRAAEFILVNFIATTTSQNFNELI